jgi:hypothetical protein
MSFKQQFRAFLEAEKSTGEIIEHLHPLSSKGISDRTVVWLALVPVWSLNLARNVGLPIAELDEAVQQQLAMVGRSGSFMTDSIVYWMDRRQRATALRHINQIKQGKQYLGDVVYQCYLALDTFREDTFSIGPPIRRWMALAMYAHADLKMSEIIEQKIDEAIKEDITLYGSSGYPETLRWVETSQLFAEVFGGTVAESVTRVIQRFDSLPRIY